MDDANNWMYVVVHKYIHYNKKIFTYKSSETLEPIGYNVGSEGRWGEFPKKSLITIERFVLGKNGRIIQVQKDTMNIE